MKNLFKFCPLNFFVLQIINLKVVFQCILMVFKLEPAILNVKLCINVVLNEITVLYFVQNGIALSSSVRLRSPANFPDYAQLSSAQKI